ncbi:MAG: (d)CMP kinase [Stenotrophobium sp.]
MHTPPVVTVDGPSGSGKGTVSRLVAQRTGWHLLDSGALYRLLALAASKAGLDMDEAGPIAALADEIRIEFRETPDRQEMIVLDGEEVTRQVRAEATGGLASRIAVLPDVRKALFDRQLAFRRSPGLVADGRDMGTVVFPDAILKIFLDASAEERARRRYFQLREMGENANLAGLHAEIMRRDERDRARAVAPLIPAEDAVTIDTTSLPPAEVLAKVDELLKSRGLI